MGWNWFEEMVVVWLVWLDFAVRLVWFGANWGCGGVGWIGLMWFEHMVWFWNHRPQMSILTSSSPGHSSHAEEPRPPGKSSASVAMVAIAWFLVCTVRAQLTNRGLDAMSWKVEDSAKSSNWRAMSWISQWYSIRMHVTIAGFHFITTKELPLIKRREIEKGIMLFTYTL
jgi:hypothetical protein